MNTRWRQIVPKYIGYENVFGTINVLDNDFKRVEHLTEVSIETDYGFRYWIVSKKDFSNYPTFSFRKKNKKG